MSQNQADDWADIEYADDWRDLDVEPDEARAWNMDPMDAERWIGMQMAIEEAHAWCDAGFDHDQVDDWLHAGLSHDDAPVAYQLEHLAQAYGASEPPMEWLQAGHSPANVSTYLRARIRLAEAPLDGPSPAIRMLAALGQEV